MSYTVFFRPRAKIQGATEGSSTYESAQEALKAVQGLEMSDERVRIIGSGGHEITKGHLEMLAEDEVR